MNSKFEISSVVLKYIRLFLHKLLHQFLQIEKEILFQKSNLIATRIFHQNKLIRNRMLFTQAVELWQLFII